jgi:hypothetical protein
LVVISQSAALALEHVHTALAPAGGAFAIPRRLTAVRLAIGAVRINVSTPVDVLYETTPVAPTQVTVPPFFTHCA